MTLTAKSHECRAFFVENELNETMLAEKEAIRSPFWRAIFPWRHTAASLTDRVHFHPHATEERSTAIPPNAGSQLMLQASL